MWINISPLPLVKFGQLHPFQYTFGLSFYRVALFFFFHPSQNDHRFCVFIVESGVKRCTSAKSTLWRGAVLPHSETNSALKSNILLLSITFQHFCGVMHLLQPAYVMSGSGGECRGGSRP